MSIYKLFVLTTTPIALIMAVQEAYRLAGGVAVVIVVQILLMSGAFLFLARLGRKERNTRDTKGIQSIDVSSVVSSEARKHENH